MPEDDPSPPTEHSSPNATVQRKASWHTRLFVIPPPLKRVFDKFPIVYYDANELPLRAPRNREHHVLHVFTSEDDSRVGNPSFNPACARWQAYLSFNDIQFRIVASNNHASPSGALPFLIPAESDSKTTAPVPANKLRRWISSQKPKDQSKDTNATRLDAYTSLLEHSIRMAWLFQLYLAPPNTELAQSLYVQPCSSNYLVQQTILYQLREAAKAELSKSSTSGAIVEDDIMQNAQEAFEALSTLLEGGEGLWFEQGDKPGLFDASVFAYTHLILDGGMQWNENRLGAMLRNHPSLVQHQKRIMESYF